MNIDELFDKNGNPLPKWREIYIIYSFVGPNYFKCKRKDELEDYLERYPYGFYHFYGENLDMLNIHFIKTKNSIKDIVEYYNKGLLWRIFQKESMGFIDRGRFIPQNQMDIHHKIKRASAVLQFLLEKGENNLHDRFLKINEDSLYDYLVNLF